MVCILGSILKDTFIANTKFHQVFLTLNPLMPGGNKKVTHT